MDSGLYVSLGHPENQSPYCPYEGGIMLRFNDKVNLQKSLEVFEKKPMDDVFNVWVEDEEGRPMVLKAAVSEILAKLELQQILES